MSEPTPPQAAPEPGRTAPSAGSLRALRAYYATLGVLGAVLVGGGWLWRGIDFAGAVLLGFAVVALNFAWTKNLVSSLLFVRQRARALVVTAYVIKFALTAVVLYIAIVRYQVDPLGILIGLSALLVASFAFAWYAPAARGGPEPGPAPDSHDT